MLYYYYTAEIANPFQPLGVVTLRNPDASQSACALAMACDDTHFSPISSSLLVGMHFPGSTNAVHFAVLAASERRISSVMVQPDPSTASLNGKHVFAIHTSQRTWHLAADTAEERSDWIRVLCEAGSQLSASSALPRSFVSSSIPAVLMKEPLAPEPPSNGPVVEMGGILWKRASKVHVNQVAEFESGKVRGWVQRYFRLQDVDSNSGATIVYLQNLDDPITSARGIVQLSNFFRCPITS